MNRRAFLTSLGAAVAATTTAHGALPPTPSTPLVYDVKASVLTPTAVPPSNNIRLDFTARRGDEVIGTAVAFGSEVNEAAEVLATILHPKSPEAASWVVDVWLPQAIDGYDSSVPYLETEEKSYLGKTALYYNSFDK